MVAELVDLPIGRAGILHEAYLKRIYTARYKYPPSTTGELENNGTHISFILYLVRSHAPRLEEFVAPSLTPPSTSQIKKQK